MGENGNNTLMLFAIWIAVMGVWWHLILEDVDAPNVDWGEVVDSARIHMFENTPFPVPNSEGAVTLSAFPIPMGWLIVGAGVFVSSFMWQYKKVGWGLILFSGAYAFNFGNAWAGLIFGMGGFYFIISEIALPIYNWNKQRKPKQKKKGRK